MKFTAVLIFVSISLVNMVEAKELIIQCKPSPPLKLVSKFFLGDKVYEKIDGKWLPYCDGDNETLEIFDKSASCTVKLPLHIAHWMNIEEKKEVEKLCKNNVDIPTLHHKNVADYIRVESLCSRQSENFFNIFIDQIIAVSTADNNFWLSTTLVDFEFSTIQYFNVGSSSEVGSEKFVVRPSWHRKEYVDAAGYPWETPDTKKGQSWPCDKY